MRSMILMLLVLLVLAGCKEHTKESVEIYNPQHTEYLQQYGWHIGQYYSETRFQANTLQDYQEHVDKIRTEGHVDLSPYLDRDVIETGYVLKEKTDHYNHIVVYILESGGAIIGSYLDFNHEVVQPSGEIQVNAGQTTPMFPSNQKDEQYGIGRFVNANND